jgi:hypothetical protein
MVGRLRRVISWKSLPGWIAAIISPLFKLLGHISTMAWLYSLLPQWAKGMNIYWITAAGFLWLTILILWPWPFKLGITDQDPQVLLEIRNKQSPDDLELHTPYNRPMIFNNRGIRDAMKVRFEMDKLNEGWAEFEEIAVLKRDEKYLEYPHIKGPNGQDIAPFQEFCLEMLLSSELNNRMNATHSILLLLKVPVKLVYEDHNGKKFSTDQSMTYYLHKNGVEGYIEFSAPTFRRL